MMQIIAAAMLLLVVMATCYCCYKIGRAVQWEEDHEEGER